MHRASRSESMMVEAYTIRGESLPRGFAGHQYAKEPEQVWLIDNHRETAHADAAARSRCRRYRALRFRIDPLRRGTPRQYLRLLDAEADGADWRDVARIVLHRNPEHEPDRARQAFDSHLARARWMSQSGYRQLLASA
jgi:hypothetical protein